MCSISNDSETYISNQLVSKYLLGAMRSLLFHLNHQKDLTKKRKFDKNIIIAVDYIYMKHFITAIQIRKDSRKRIVMRGEESLKDFGGRI
jgi:hypothetical protein